MSTDAPLNFLARPAPGATVAFEGSPRAYLPADRDTLVANTPYYARAVISGDLIDIDGVLGLTDPPPVKPAKTKEAK